MKKIIRLTENDLFRIVKKVLNEQFETAKNISNTKNPYDYHLILDPPEQIRLYKDQQNTITIKGFSDDSSKPEMNCYLNEIMSSKNGIELSIQINNLRQNDSKTTVEYSFNFDCSSEYIESDNFPLAKQVYNTNLIQDLRLKFCTKNSGGKWVRNIGKYSNLDSNKPTNIA